MPINNQNGFIPAFDPQVFSEGYSQGFVNGYMLGFAKASELQKPLTGGFQPAPNGGFTENGFTSNGFVQNGYAQQNGGFQPQNGGFQPQSSFTQATVSAGEGESAHIYNDQEGNCLLI